MHALIRPLFIHLLLLLACASGQAMSAYKTPFTAQSDLALLSEKGVLPRNINLKTFDPHRAEFVCAHAATKAPALKPDAQELFEEGMALTSPALWPNERNWPRAMALWSQAAEQGHWKAALMWIQTARTGNGVNGPKGQFQVPPQDRELVVSRVEYLMRQGVADGFYLMGVFHEEGYGVKQNVDRAWAFWELAADMGSARAQTKIGKSLGFVDRAQEKPGVAEWANIKVQYQMLECAYAQGYGPAGHKLGLLLDLDAENGRAKNGDKEAQFARARQVLHDAVKFGSEAAAGYLFTAFDDGEPLVGKVIDTARAQRYRTLADALFNNPDLRFPNLDKVLPLPPAKLPVWDGQRDSLINAAKGVRETPTQKPSAANALPPEHPAHVPAGHAIALPADHGTRGTAAAPLAGTVWNGQAARYVHPAAPWAGYYTAHQQGTQQSTQRTALPLYFAQGQTLALRDGAGGLDSGAGIEWVYHGVATPVTAAPDWLARAGTLRAIAQAGSAGCKGNAACPATGIWQPHVLAPDHPLHPWLGSTAGGEGWKWQAFVAQGQAMPSLQALGWPVEDAQVDWRLMQTTEVGFDV